MQPDKKHGHYYHQNGLFSYNTCLKVVYSCYNTTHCQLLHITLNLMLFNIPEMLATNICSLIIPFLLYCEIVILLINLKVLHPILQQQLTLETPSSGE